MQKCYKTDIFNNTIEWTIVNVPYVLNYMGEIKLSPSGDYTLIAKTLFKDGERIGEVDSNYYWLDDHTLFNGGCGSNSDIYSCNFNIFRFTEHPYNYTISKAVAYSQKSMLSSRNPTNIIYTSNDRIYLIDLNYKAIESFPIDVIGQKPSDIYITDQGVIYATWNTLLFKWVPSNTPDD